MMFKLTSSAVSVVALLGSIDISSSFSLFHHHHSMSSISSSTTLLSSSRNREIVPPTVDKEANDKLLDLYNYQITREFAASQLYLSASIWCDERELVGMASYMLNESNEERTHGLSLIDFASKRNIDIKLEPIPAPTSNWDNVEELWKDMLVAEEENTQALLNLADAAQSCHDYAILAFLQPFHIEQLDSESNLKTIIAKVKDENETPGLLRQLDYELGNSK